MTLPCKFEGVLHGAQRDKAYGPPMSSQNPGNYAGWVAIDCWLSLITSPIMNLKINSQADMAAFIDGHFRGIIKLDLDFPVTEVNKTPG